jgi:hypothetical protein
VLGSNRVLLRDDNLPDLPGERLVRVLDRRIERLNVPLDARPGLLNLACGPGDQLTEVMGVSMIVEGFVVEAEPLAAPSETMLGDNVDVPSSSAEETGTNTRTAG